MTDPAARAETRPLTVEIPTYAPSRGLPRLWPDSYQLAVQAHDGYVNIIGDSAGLRGLAVQLLALAAEEVPAGYASDLDDLAELDAGSVALTIIRQ
jgi:hypothetical protein